jgi:hypothetical protein
VGCFFFKSGRPWGPGKAFKTAPHQQIRPDGIRYPEQFKPPGRPKLVRLPVAGYQSFKGLLLRSSEPLPDATRNTPPEPFGTDTEPPGTLLAKLAGIRVSSRSVPGGSGLVPARARRTPIKVRKRWVPRNWRLFGVGRHVELPGQY